MENIDRQRLKWMEAIQTGDLEAFGALLTEDAVWLPPGQVAFVGRSAIQAWLAPLFGQFEYDLSVADVQVRMAGDWAVEQAHFTSRLTDTSSGEVLQHQSRYLLLWRRDRDGVWQIERYIDTSV